MTTAIATNKENDVMMDEMLTFCSCHHHDVARDDAVQPGG
jgi:hypothetical protein